MFSLAHWGIQTSDDAATLASAGALWDRHTLAIPEMEWLDERVNIGRHGRDGLLYSKYGLGQTVTVAVLYGIGKTLFPETEPFVWAGYPIVDSGAGAALAQFTNVFLGSLVVGFVVYEAGKRFGSDAATLAGMMLALASPLWLAVRGFGSEIGAALGILLAAMTARRAMRPESSVPLWLSVVGLGGAALFRPSALAFGIAWVVWLWHHPFRDWVKVGAVFAVVIAMLAGYNWIRYRDFLEFGYSDGGSGFSPQVAGLLGYLFAPGRSLLVFAPWAVLMIPYAVQAFRGRCEGSSGIVMGSIGFYIFHSMWCKWEGGFAYGPRLLIPVLPVVAFSVAHYFVEFPRLNILLFLPASLVQVAALAVDPTITIHTISGSGLTLQQRVWSITDNIVVQQLKATATPEHFVWLVLWVVMLFAWSGLSLSGGSVQTEQKSQGLNDVKTSEVCRRRS